MFLHRMRERIKKWILEKGESPSARWWLFVLSFLESSISPIPPDVLLIAMLMRPKSRWVLLSSIVVAGSVLGGIAGYALGAFLFESLGHALVAFYGLEDEFALVGERFSDNAFLALFAAAFTPIPYKIFTIGAGVFDISLALFIGASVIGRSLRYITVGVFMRYFGAKSGPFIYRHFNVALLLATLIAVVVFVFVMQ